MTSKDKRVERGQQERRSHRLTLAVPVRVEYFVNNPGRLSSDTITIKVNAHGALFQSPWGVPVGWTLLLQNLASLETETGTVAFVEYAGDDYYDVGVGFAQPNPAFWGIASPPEDWLPKSD